MNKQWMRYIFKHITVLMILYGIALQPFQCLLAIPEAQQQKHPIYLDEHTTERVTPQELEFITAHPDVPFVYISRKLHAIIKPFIKEFSHTSNSALWEINDLIQQNVHIVRYEVMMQALDELLEYASLDETTKDLLLTYKQNLETTYAQETHHTTALRISPSFYNLFVQSKLFTESLVVTGNATFNTIFVQRNLRVNEDVIISGNLIVTGSINRPSEGGDVNTASNFTLNNAITTVDLPNGTTSIKQSTVTIDSTGNIDGVKVLRLQDNSGSGDYVGLSAPATVGTSYTLSLPSTAPAAGQILAANAVTPTNLEWITSGGSVTPVSSQTIYVTKFGNDTTGNGSFTSPYASLAKAVDVANTLSSATTPITINLGAGVYTENNSAGPIEITAPGISVVGASIEGTVIQPDTLSQALIQCSTNGLEFNSFTIDAGASGSTASGIIFASNAAGNTRFESLAAYRFLTAFECNGSDGTPILIFNNVQPRGNGTGISLSSCRAIIKNAIFLGAFTGTTPSNTGITITGATSLVTILSNSFRLMNTAVSVTGNSSMRILGSNIESTTNGVLSTGASISEIIGCNFLVNNTNSINVASSGAGTVAHVSSCHFDCADLVGENQGIALQATAQGAVLATGSVVHNAITAIKAGTPSDTSSTVMRLNNITLDGSTNDITQHGTATLVINNGVADVNKIIINDTTNVHVAFFDTASNNSLGIGKFSDTNTTLLEAHIAASNPVPAINYVSSLYNTQAIGYTNTSTQTWFTLSPDNSNIAAITSDRSKAAALNLFSDTGATIGGTTALRGWNIQKNPTTAELAFSYQNSDVTGQSVVTSYTVFQLDGVNNQVQLPTANTQIVFSADTNLYRSAGNTLKTDDNFVAAGTISATSGFTGNLTGNVTGAASLNVLKSGDTMTGALILPAGSATSPTLQFTGSTNTGISAGTANILSFDTNGSERMNISSSGVTIPAFSTAGIVHNNAIGLLSSSLIVNADITDATIANTKLATISSTNTAGNIVVRDGSGNFATNMITIAGATTNSTDVATKAYVDSTISSGIVAKEPALVASTTDVTISGLQTIDGVLLVANDRVLLVGQTDPVENGLWLAQVGAWTRPADFNTGDPAGEAYVLVTSGSTYAGASWLCTTPAAIIGTDDIFFQQFSIPGQTTGANVGAGTGEIFKNKTGNTINFRTIVAGTHLTATTNTDDVTLATDATNANTASTIVARDASGNFSAGTITASITGASSLNVLKTGDTMTGVLTLPAGSAGTPALQFTGSTNTGISAATADTLSFDTGGSERMNISSSGVAVPAFSTAGVVHNNASGLLSSSLIVNADITNATIANAKLATIDSANTAGAIVVRDGSGNFSAGTITANLAGNVTGSASLNVLKAGDTMIGPLLLPVGSAATPALQIGATNVGLSSPTSNLLFSTNGTSQLGISSGGTVSITTLAGTAGVVHNDASGNVSSSLIVNADVAAAAAIADTKLATISTAGKVANSATTATSTNTANAIVARDASGNFAAGTITLNAGSAAAPTLQFTGSTNTGISAPTANALAFSIGGASRLAIDSSGNVTYSSNYKVNVYVGTTRTITSSTETVRFDIENFDPNNNFDTTTWTYTVPVTGYYFVSAQVYFLANSGSNTTPRTIQLVKNGVAQIGYSSSTTAATANQLTTLNLASIIQLTAGNTLRVDFSGITTSGGDQIHANGSSLNIHFMSL